MTRPRQQRGAATLMTVMVLFFVMALVAAYANRNLIVEQRVAQTFQSLGAANEAGNHAAERMLSLLNADNVNEACEPDADGPNTLRQRALRFAADGRIDVPTAAKGVPNPWDGPYTIYCDRIRAQAWVCQCPVSLKPVAQEDDTQVRESAVMRIRTLSGKEGISRVGLAISACGGPSKGCLDVRQSAFAMVDSVRQFGLVRALKMPPVSPLVARGDVDLGTGMLVVHNEPSHGGIALQSGGAVAGNLSNVQGPAGAPATSSLLVSDATLAPLSDDECFRRFFGLRLLDYVAQPAMRRLQCPNDCAKQLELLSKGGAHLIWHDGDLTLSGDVTIGNAAAPVVLIVKGNLLISGALQFHGLIFSAGNLVWSNASMNPSVVHGAVLVAGTVQGESGTSAVFSGAVLDILKLQGGSFVPLPGGTTWGKKW